MKPRPLLLLSILLAGCGSETTGTGDTDVQSAVDVDAEVTADVDVPEPRVDGTDANSEVETEVDAAGAADAEVGPDLCYAEVPEEARVIFGANPGGPWVTLGGRAVTPAGPSIILEGFPTDVALHPTAGVAYVTATGRDDRRLTVVDLASQEILQDIDRGEAFYGLMVSPDGGTVYASGGKHHTLETYSVAADGQLALSDDLDVGGYPSGLALSPGGATLWLGLFSGDAVLEIDTATLTETRRFELSHDAWDVEHVASRGQVYASDLAGQGVSVIDLEAGAVVDVINVPTSPAGMAVSADGSRVWVAASGADAVAAINTDTHEVDGWAVVAPTLYGQIVPSANVNALWSDEARGRLYASLGSEDAVAVLDVDSLELLGTIPTGYYPSDLELSADGATLVVAEGKGGGAGPNDGLAAKERLAGSVTTIAMTDLDLAAATEQVATNARRARSAFPFDCEGFFPVPMHQGQVSPIEHVILVVKENKTFDCVFADMADELDIDADTEHLRWPEDITPNIHALARQYNVSDNFYSEAPNSDNGHIFLTSAHITEYIERAWLDSKKLDDLLGYQLLPGATPSVGNYFVHLLDHDRTIQIYGEIVGMFAESKTGKGQPVDYSDGTYPGGPFVNYKFPDEDKAEYIAGRIAEGQLADFTYVLFPNDHTQGTDVGYPTPESMVADNDRALGVLVDAVSHSPLWDKTAIIVLQDDPQGCHDHVDAHRAFVMVISPWARRGYVSHAFASFASVFATVDRILGVPALSRAAAVAAPLWDMFTPVKDSTPFTALERTVPHELNPEDLPGAEKSRRMDWRSADRNPELPVVLDAYRLWRMGRISKTEAQARLASPVAARSQWSEEHLDELDEEAEEETFAFDRDWARYQHWRQQRGLPPAELPR